MKSAFLKEANSFKNQILDTSESTSHLRSQNESNNNNNTRNVLERLITHLEDEVSTSKVQLDRKDKIINILLGKIENHVNEGTCKRPNEKENSFITRNLSKGNNEENLTQLNVEEMNIAKNNDSSQSPNKSSLKEKIMSPAKTSTEDTPQRQSTSCHGDENESSIEMPNTSSEDSSKRKEAKQNNNSNKSVVILGDSMTKHTNGWDIAKKVKLKCKVYAKTFPGATIKCMADYMKPSIRAKPDHAILHIGTNDLNSNATPNEIVANIVNLAAEMKTEKCTVSISGIIIRTDKPELNKKGLEVNIILKELCMEKNIFSLIIAKKSKQVILTVAKSI